MTTDNDTAPAAGTPLFYSRPVPLQSDAHADLRILPGRLQFAAKSNAIPLVVGEFAMALQSFPILFAGPAAVPMAALGITEDNLFIADGQWEEDTYVPAYVRRHPFIFIDTDGGKNFVLGIDEDSDRLVKGGEEGNPLFEDGKASEMVQQALEFCGRFTGEHEQTQAFSKALVEQDLLVVRNANVRLPNGREMTLQGFSVVDVEKFQKLPDAVVLDWHRKGWLALVHQHLMSLSRFSELTRRQALREA
ncbi:SapC family protein [Stenotrophomonas tumulicola]|uniref:SapC family protein n=1 Tax=Stenotrophomonas tumulicola TaxID=1685415 RepID=A0A7W3FKG9_9GAMM|nr:SapC family protein [Stenotrophomonas tumulicola]MBA8681164.1 SapC family protein [Stenotrophomonas tumulicola]